ncbi:E3 ubiquitin-protein ligase Midline-1-like [Amphiura filiformis]|uniref:E3 ubiquitin-protein ligase Midline-1-like n=1 Tax=Amphiura filiformis TaxID=82378 RepID=UPI003B218D12
MRAHNSVGWSPWSTILLLKTKEETMPKTQKEPVIEGAAASGRGAPRIDISRTEVGGEIVMLQWNPCQGMTSDAHIVAYCTTDTGREDWIYIVTQDQENSFVVSGLSPGTAYLFKVGSCSKQGFSDWSRKVKIKLGEQKLPTQQFQKVQQVNETSFALDKQTAHPCLLLSGKSIVHPSNACPSISDFFTDNCYSVFGTATFNSRNGGVFYWEVIIHGEGSKVRIGVAEPNVNMSQLVGSSPDAWVLVMDARKPSNRQGSFVMYGNQVHKSGGQWIPFTKYIGVQLDFNKREIIFIEYNGPRHLPLHVPLIVFSFILRIS